jgi:ATP-binding protein involved in chromosome partitioning
MRGTTPVEIEKREGRDIRVVWDDGHVSVYPNPELRWLCSCASCVDEWSGERHLDRASVPGDVQPAWMGLVGNYAIQISWSDGHSTGIYSFEYLRAICSCAACVAART